MDEADLKAILVKLGKDLSDQNEMLWRAGVYTPWRGQAWHLQTHTPIKRNIPSRANRKAVVGFL